ncbi:MAG: rod shape-determining protein RodA [Solibacterales bacterium]|nr:rod shape-determining protein RodA [Bryobacterales bacterium]|tara:strand:- start:16134 stop:17225 length:1092 start_codon:yes stop_codon:yes gene_type:complete
MMNDRLVKDFDWLLLGIAIIIAIVGVFEIYSATSNTGWQGAYVKQLLWLTFALVFFWFFSLGDYNAVVNTSPILYMGSLALLVAILTFGIVLGGGRRWLGLPGGVTIQISELTKVVLILLVAKHFKDTLPGELKWKDLLTLGAMIGIPTLLVARQPDLSTALSFLVILVIGLFVAGLRWKYIAVFGLIVAFLIPIAWHQLEPYQQERLITFIDPEKDPRGSGYQQIQSRIAVGAGGIWGAGFSKGSQTQLMFIPVPHTDFIFSAYAEETGFIGVTSMLALYFGLLMKIVGVSLQASDNTGRHICMGTAALILFHVIVNVGMVIGYMPVTGLPLPLMSYGGSNLVTVFILLGLVNSVHMRRFTN